MIRSLVILLFFLIATPVYANQPYKILLFGDSLIYGYGVGKGQGLVPRMESFFKQRGYNITFINAGVPGHTSAQGLRRLSSTLDKYAPNMVILALGGNDVLRRIPPSQTRKNIDKMLSIIRSKQIPTILSAVQAFPHYPSGYVESFNAIYPELAQKYNVNLYPFFLVDTYGKKNLMQRDGIHPNAAGYKVIAEKLNQYLLAGFRQNQ